MTPSFADSACVTTRERLVVRGGSWKQLRLKVRYGILRHPAAGLVLIDTGYSPRATAGAGRGFFLRVNTGLLRPKLLAEGQPEAVLRQLGAAPADVDAIVLTHFHADHVAGLDLFPQARVFAKRVAYQRIRNRSALANARHGIYPELLPEDLGARMGDLDSLTLRAAPLGLGNGRDVFGDGSLLAIDLPGHAEGHVGLCFPQLPVPLLYAVDVQWCAPALDPGKAPGLPASLVADDLAALMQSMAKVRDFRARGGELLLCHDPRESPYDLPKAIE